MTSVGLSTKFQNFHESVPFGLLEDTWIMYMYTYVQEHPGY